MAFVSLISKWLSKFGVRDQAVKKKSNQGMNGVPYEFVELLCLIIPSCQHIDVKQIEELSGKYHVCAEKLIREGHAKVLNVQDNRITLASCYDYQLKPIQEHANFDFQNKFTFRKHVFFFDQDQSTQVDGRKFKNLAASPGELHLHLRTSNISEEWIEQLSSWSNLTMLVVHVDASESIFKLVQQWVKNGSLLRICIRRLDFPIDDYLEIFASLFNQPQFYGLEIEDYHESLVKLFSTTCSQQYSQKRLVIRRAIRRSQVDSMFGRIWRFGTVEKPRSSKYLTNFYANSKICVQYYNPDGDLDMSLNAFMSGVTRATFFKLCKK
ncbi:hypothetical protein L596_022288 [Steinernema carpocapsae]|uniref:Uncharacterized protein n=1 Tax=Steinernema carpocapsae TaxID=34508 RepID=A0A4U5MLA7_STECR|nr:hypothetical protein L596_022288 [Steinernema carpocapsae]